MKPWKQIWAAALVAGVLFGRTTEEKSVKEKFGNHVVTQIGIVVRDIEKTSQAWADLLGMGKPQIIITDPVEIAHTKFRGEATEARAKLAFFHLQNLTIELIEPIGENSTWREVLEERGEGVHHIAVQVDDMPQSIVFLNGQGGELVQQGDFTGGSYAYIDMMKRLGVIVELLTSSDK